MFDSVDRTTGRDLGARVDADELRAHLDAFEGLHRYPGTDDQWEAAEYVRGTLDSYGVDADIETVEAYTSVPVDAGVTVTAPRREALDAITVSFGANTPDGGVSGGVVPVESTDPAALAGVDGAVALVRGLPTPAAVRALDAAGAAAVVFESPTPGELHEMIVSPVWGTPGADDADRLPGLPVAEVGREDGERLRELAAGDGVEVSVRAETDTRLRELPCPVGRIDGTGSDRYLLIGNHIDSWHEGITDNATAMAATLEVARVFADDPPKRGLVFGFWPGHSMGRYAGSARYADRHWLDLRENGVAYLHLDLNGLEGADVLWAQHMAELEAEHLDVLEGGPLPLGGGSGDGDLIGTSDRPGRNSDQSFWGAGLSSLLSGARFSPGHDEGGPVGGGWWWHTPEDTRDKVDVDLLVEESRLYVAIASRICNSPVLPHDFRRTCRDVRAALDGVEAAAGDAVDFAPVRTRLGELEANLDEVAEIIDGPRIDDLEAIAADVEDLQVRLGNLLVPALYMEVPEYEHEPALPHDLLPSLRVAEGIPETVGPRRRFAEISARRGVTRLAHRIGRANDRVEAFLAGRSG